MCVCVCVCVYTYILRLDFNSKTLNCRPTHVCAARPIREDAPVKPDVCVHVSIYISIYIGLTRTPNPSPLSGALSQLARASLISLSI